MVMAAPTLNLQDYHRTSDMALVAWLKMEGHSPQKVAWEGDTCYWYFRITGTVLALCDDFAEGRALVEPKEYNRHYQQSKREFFNANPNDRRPRRR